MNEQPQEKYWYQNGELIFVIVWVVAWLVFAAYAKWAQTQVWNTVPRITGHVEESLFGTPSLVITIWHQTPGDIKNGSIAVSVTGSGADGTDDDMQIHSFETWPPNKDQAVTFTFTLPEYQPDREIPITISVLAKNLQTFESTDAWVNNDWKSNSEPVGPH